MLEMVTKRLCQVFSLVVTKMPAASRIHLCLQAANETLQEHSQRFTDLVSQVTGPDLTVVIYQVTIVLFSRHLLNKETQKQLAGAKTIQTLRYIVTLAQEAEIKLKK